MGHLRSHQQVRIIPALAGNTTGRCQLRRHRTDHPRSRGEYVAAAAAGLTWFGSSPLSRGILVGAAQAAAVRGIIPALAGNTQFPWPQVHAAGIIPALAGNTNRGRGAGGIPWDHPRSRGEYLPAAVFCMLGYGSSPLSRGIRRVETAAHRGARIIPALAGNTRIRVGV